LEQRRKVRNKPFITLVDLNMTPQRVKYVPQACTLTTKAISLHCPADTYVYKLSDLAPGRNNPIIPQWRKRLNLDWDKKDVRPVSGGGALPIRVRKEKRGNKYTVFGEYLTAPILFNALPSILQQQRRATGSSLPKWAVGKTTNYVKSGGKHSVTGRDCLGIRYPGLMFNRRNLAALQAAINKVNTEYRGYRVDTSMPYESNVEPSLTEQIIGCDVAPNFPACVAAAIAREKLPRLGIYGPVRTREHTSATWAWVYGDQHIKRDRIMKVITWVQKTGILQALFPVYIRFQTRGNTAEKALGTLLTTESMVCAVAGWGTRNGKRGHARTLMKVSRPGTFSKVLYVLDPWMDEAKGAKIHKDGRKRLRVAASALGWTLKWLSRDREQGREKSCVATACARAMMIAHRAEQSCDGDALLAAATAPLEPWIPAIIKMFLLRFPAERQKKK
jgi:hypothetical protein